MKNKELVKAKEKLKMEGYVFWYAEGHEIQIWKGEELHSHRVLKDCNDSKEVLEYIEWFNKQEKLIAHTQGGWNLLRQGKELLGDGGHEVVANIGGIPVSICELCTAQISSLSNPLGLDTEYVVSEKESIANGYVLAASSDLLKACKAAYNKLAELEQDAEQNIFIADEMSILEKAITKAKGD